MGILEKIVQWFIRIWMSWQDEPFKEDMKRRGDLYEKIVNNADELELEGDARQKFIDKELRTRKDVSQVETPQVDLAINEIIKKGLTIINGMVVEIRKEGSYFKAYN